MESNGSVIHNTVAGVPVAATPASVATCETAGAANAPGTAAAGAGRLLVSDGPAACSVTVMPAATVFSGSAGKKMPILPVRHPLLLGAALDWVDLRDFLPRAEPGTDPRLTRSALASSFAAALELAKQGRAEIAQDHVFGPLRLRAAAVAS